MQELDDSERALVALARSGLGPTPDDAARVLARVEQALAAGAAPAGPGEGRAPAEPISRPLASTWQAPTARWLRRIGLALSIAGTSGLLGYWLGLEAGRGQVRPRAGLEAPAAPARQSTAAGASTAPPAAVVRLDTPASVNPAPRAVLASGARAPAAVSARKPAPPLSADSLQREVAALRAIERALRDREPGDALELLDALDRELPQGRLMEERAAASSIARCALGLGRREGLVEEFARAHPDSMYLERVQQGCAKR